MDKKTKTIVIVVVAIVVLGGLFYGYNRWRQQRLANQILLGMYGVNTGVLGGLTGNGKIQEQIAKEIAAEAEQAKKDEEKQKEDEAKEAAKTPEDRFNETKSVTLTGQTSSLVAEKVEPQLTAVFGKIKPVLFSDAYLGQKNSFLVSFKVPRIPGGEDVNKLTEEFTKAGYTVAMNSVSADGANLLFDNEEATISISYGDGDAQEIGVLYYEKASVTNE
ncbi:MAG: hypothetical protein WC458_02200 [Patescibacteria group bacterium]